MLEVYRLNSSRYPANNGRGAALHGGRWNPVGLEVIYAAQSRSLAALEVLVHYAILPLDFVCTPIRMPEHLVTNVHENAHVGSGYFYPQPGCLTDEQHFGPRWIPKHVALSVPSAIIPQERIYLLNPAHTDFNRVQFLDSEPFRFDPRLKHSVTSGPPGTA
jgi:RES domain-containing protein